MLILFLVSLFISDWKKGSGICKNTDAVIGIGPHRIAEVCVPGILNPGVVVNGQSDYCTLPEKCDPVGRPRIEVVPGKRTADPVIGELGKTSEMVAKSAGKETTNLIEREIVVRSVNVVRVVQVD